MSNRPVSNRPVSNRPVSNRPVSNRPVSNRAVSNGHATPVALLSLLTLLSLLSLLVVAACDGPPPALDGGLPGDVTVIVESEDTITSGLRAGDTGEAIQDGWDVTFATYNLVIGDIDVHLATDDSVVAEAPERFVVDLVDVPESGLPLWGFDDLTPGRWAFHYAIAGAADGATRHSSVPEAELAEMAAGDWTYLIDGTMRRAGGQSCPPASLASPGARTANGNTNADGDPCYDAAEVHFRLGVSAETTFGPCEIDEMPGFAVTAGTTTVAATIHGDHLFFNGFPEGGEGGVMRLAQWLADCDLDLDGEVTRDELEAIAPADLVELDGRFQLGGSPVTPLLTMWDYVVGQLKTQGHMDGEGECPYDGVAHDHM